jgi:MFS family permease
MKNSKWILPLIVIAQFCCTSLWFAVNAVMVDLSVNFHLESNALEQLTSVIQFGFIIGTLTFALLTIADRFSPSKVFCFSALSGALLNALMLLEMNTLTSLLLLRFLTGFFLAGIYPIGMKIAADYYEKGLGKSLGFLVGALVLGTAFPHLLKSFDGILSWETLVLTTSCLALFGGLLMLAFVPNGPYRKASQVLDFGAIFRIFKVKEFRVAAIGYFGHMWELYTFWMLVPILLTSYFLEYPSIDFNINWWAFIIIGIGSLGCVFGAYLAEYLGTKKTATLALSLSLFCCGIAPFMFEWASPIFFVLFLMFWGMVVIADSPLFSTLVASSAPSATKGTALTIVNCIGFSITIISIQILTIARNQTDEHFVYWLLALGPIIGLLFIYKSKKNTNEKDVSL